MNTGKTLKRALLLGVALAFLSVGTGEGFFHRHHHHETEDHCAYCHWCHTGSQAVMAQAPPPLFPFYFVCSIPARHTEPTLARLIHHQGRAPPHSPSDADSLAICRKQMTDS